MPNAVSVTPPYVEEVVPGSPAATAGLRPDDLIVYIDGELVPSVKAFRDILKQTNPGTQLQLEIQRGNQLKTISVVVRNADSLTVTYARVTSTYDPSTGQCTSPPC